MDWTAYVRTSLTRRHASPDDGVVEELAQHAKASYETARADGLSADDAERRVRALVDGWCDEAPRTRARRPPVIVEPVDTSSRPWTGVIADLRYGARRMRREPGFALMATLLVALGVGAATTLGNLAYSVLVKPLPWPGADRIVLLSEKREGATRGPAGILTNATYLAWREQPGTLDGLAAYSTSAATITVGGDAERVRVGDATASLFAVLGARPAVGNVFTIDDESATGDRVAVVSYTLWQRRFAGSRDAVGKTFDIDGDRYRVVAAMPAGFEFPNRATQVWVPMHVPPVLSANAGARTVSLFRGVGRLKLGATTEQASAEGTARGRAAPALGMVGTAVFGTQGPPRVSAAPYLESVTADIRPALLVLLAAVVLLLTAAVANIAGMQLTRATERRREVAIRTALGARPGRLARQLLTESLLIGLAGGVGGWLLSLGLHGILPRWLPPDFPRTDQILADWRLAAFSIGAAVVVSVLFGSVPAIVSRRLNVVETLVEDSLAPIGTGLRTRLGRLRAVAMTGQVAVATILLVGAALLGRSFLAMQHVDRGYEPRNLLTATLPMPDAMFSGQRRAAILDAILDRLKGEPGVVSVATASTLPLLPYDQPMGFSMPSDRGRNEMIPVQADLRSVSPDYFAALGTRVVEGRGFSAADTLSSQPVVIVNRTFVEKYLSGRAVGARLPIGLDAVRDPWREIVGVVDDVRQRGAADPTGPEVYLPYRQRVSGMDMPAPAVLVRTSGDPLGLVSALRSAVHDADHAVALDSVMTMDERVMTSLARPRLYAGLLATFAGFALLVAGVGLFGTLSHSVAQRTRELGVRAALGARPSAIIALVVRQGLATTAIGIAAGLLAALWLVRFVGTLLYGVTTHDPLSLVAVPALLVIVAALAAIAPARRAARINPLTAMRKT
jgi:predicted permease